MAEFSLAYFLIRIGFGALGCFCAILFWPRNRDAAWVFIILGTLVLYLHLVFELLVKVNLLVPEYFVIAGQSFFEVIFLILGVLPFLFFAIAFIIMVARK
jgi:hypothetical protein